MARTMAKAKAERKEKLQSRAAELKSDYQARTSKLKQARELTKEALAA